MIMSAMQHRVLVIDDELGPRESLRILLKNEYEVVTADSVARGLQSLRERPPDTIVMDIRMPGTSGIEVLREIRQIDPHVSVIMLTGYGALETAQEAIRLGANDYMKKPFDTQEMLSTIRRNVKRSEMTRRRIRTESELQNLNRSLVDELAKKDRMASLGQASAELVHDLRNPLAVILGYTEILAEDLEKAKRTSGGDTTDAFAHVDVIANSVRRCRELIESWLALARPGRRPSEALDLTALVNDVVSSFGFVAAERKAILDLRLPPEVIMVRSDPPQLRRVLQNIIGNAIDALPGENGRVVVECLRAGDRAEILVEDNGCGIPADKQKQLFQPYFTTKPAGQGTGLGLFITRKILEELGGGIELQSAPGSGTRASIRLPAAV